MLGDAVPKKQDIVSRLHLAPWLIFSLIILSGCGSGASMQSVATTTTTTTTTPTAPTDPTTPTAPTAPTSTAAQVVLSGQTTVREGAQAQMTAQVTGLSNTQVTWQVNGITAGNSSVGTISSAGLYSAPAAIPTSGTVTISAFANAQTSASASMTETILNPVVSVTSAVATLITNMSITLQIEGSGFIQGTTVSVNGTTISPTVVSSSELTASATISQGAGSVSVIVTNPAPGSTSSASFNVTIPYTVATPIAAARILDQTSFGPTAETIQQVEQEGIAAYLQNQLQQPASLIQISLLPNVSADTLPAYCLRSGQNCFNFSWWNNAIKGPDQLRQRVAFALSQIFVISEDTVWIGAFPNYINILSQDSFSNWFTIMHDVTLSPGMGVYLNMMNSSKAPTGQIPNENYPREFMQLFSIGIDQLNIDGTPVLDTNGNTTSNYTEAQVEAFARAYTGWTSSTPDGSLPTTAVSSSHLIYTAPMVAVESNHDTTQKILLNGTVLPAGQTAEEDLNDALTNIFNDSSLPPFVCKQLIQHLVTSNPSPEYVSRVAQVFVNDGTGVRGNMSAVLTAIFLDSEARTGDSGAASENFGHLREPILWLTASMRGLEATEATGDASSYQGIDTAAAALSEPVFEAPSVFNFYAPGNLLAGTTLLAPEFGLENTASVMLKLNITDAIVANTLSKETVDLSATGTLGKLAASSPQQLLDQLSLVFLHGNMSTDMRNTILDAINGISDPAQQVRIAVYLVLTSPQFKVIS
jgi:uncharacterized protein (DUF1800 family)